MPSLEEEWGWTGWFMMTSSTRREVKQLVRRSTKKEAKEDAWGIVDTTRSSSRRSMVIVLVWFCIVVVGLWTVALREALVGERGVRLGLD
jgi:hypothetical protein